MARLITDLADHAATGTEGHISYHTLWMGVTYGFTILVVLAVATRLN